MPHEGRGEGGDVLADIQQCRVEGDVVADTALQAEVLLREENGTDQGLSSVAQ